MDSNGNLLLEKTLARGATQRATIRIVLGLMLAAPPLWLGLMWATAPALERPLRSGEKFLLFAAATLLVAGVATLVAGIRTLGARGTRVGRTVLDSPEQVFSVQHIARDITVNGIGVRKVHLLKINIDAGDSMEVQIGEHEAPVLLASLRSHVGGHAFSAE